MRLRCVLGTLLFFFIFYVTPCDDCKEVNYEDTPTNVLACQSGKLSVRSMPCFGRPDTCSYAATGTKLTFTVAKTSCTSGVESTGCASEPVDFDCTGAPLAAGTFEVGQASIDVAADWILRPTLSRRATG